MEPENGISILIRTSNSENSLRILLGQLQIAAPDELIVVDTGSQDQTIAIAEQAGAKVIRNEGPFNYSRTINLGFAAAGNSWVLVLSSHCQPINRPFPECYRRALSQLPEPPAVLYGLQFLSRSQYHRADKTPQRYTGTEALAPLRGGGNANALYAKSAWEMHPFDEGLQTGEDTAWRTWAAGAGLVLAQAAEAGVFYRHTGGPAYRFKKACDEVWSLGDNFRPVSLPALAVGFAHATRHLLWEELAPRAWLGQMAHQLGTFVASHKRLVAWLHLKAQ